MHDDADFLSAVAAHPQDQLTRLVYADWLDERGDPRGELIRIEEEVRFEPAWSEVLWSQKPRRNELRAKCDPAWLAAMRYGTDCLPLFYGRPFPDQWRDGWRLIREATERWLGVPMPDVGGHGDEVAAVEKRLGLTLPPSVREYVAFAHDLPAENDDWIGIFQDPFTMEMVPGHDAISLFMHSGGDTFRAVSVLDLAMSNPPVTSYHLFHGAHEDDGEYEREPLTRFLFLYAVGCGSQDHASMSVPVNEVATIRRQLDAAFIHRTVSGRSTCYEDRNICVWLGVPGDYSEGFIDVRIPRPVSREEIPAFLWELTNYAGSFSGVFAEEQNRHR